MKKSLHLILIALFLLSSVLILFSTTPPYAFAQEETGYQSISTEELKEKLEKNGFKDLSLGTEAQKYYRFLSDAQK